MTYIINPIWFYLIDLFYNLNFVASVLIILSCSAFIILFACSFGEDVDRYRKVRKNLLIIFIVCLSLIVVIPSKETMIEMMIAKMATYSNVENAVEIIKCATDYIFTKIGELK